MVRHIHPDGGAWRDGDTVFADVTTWECERMPGVFDLEPATRTVTGGRGSGGAPGRIPAGECVKCRMQRDRDRHRLPRPDGREPASPAVAPGKIARTEGLGAPSAPRRPVQKRSSGAPDRLSPGWSEVFDFLSSGARVQAKGDLDPGRADIGAVAAKGVEGPGTALPHRENIQASFGKHDIGHIRAHVGGEAARASEAIGADAYATGTDVAFAGPPDLHTAAHEAAHAVQQTGGVELAGGVGEPGDRYERHADRVADLVVKDQSAESTLDEVADPGTPGRSPAGAPIQKQTRVTLIDAREIGGPADGVELPESRDPQVSVLDESAGECRLANRSAVVDSPFFADNHLVFVDPIGDPWTLSVEKLVFTNALGLTLEVPWGDIDFGSGQSATVFSMSGGFFYPLRDDMTTRAFDAHNTPNIVRAAKLVFDVIAELKAQRVEYAELTYVFSGAIASLGAAHTIVRHYQMSPQSHATSRRGQDGSRQSKPRHGEGATDKGLAGRGFQPPEGTRVRPPGVPGSWRTKGTKGTGGVRYIDPKNPHNTVRVMPGNPNSPYPNSRTPYVRWVRNGQSLDVNGNVVPKNSPDAHIPLADFRYIPDRS